MRSVGWKETGGALNGLRGSVFRQENGVRRAGEGDSELFHERWPFVFGMRDPNGLTEDRARGLGAQTVGQERLRDRGQFGLVLEAEVGW